jgi:cation transport regulator ChaC
LSGALWVFGYGSLVWRPGMSVLEGQPAWIDGWARRFWQGSPDHRGTPEDPGRVATLIEVPGERCHGQAWRVDPQVLEALDYREKAGYARLMLPTGLADGRRVTALTYVAKAGNSDWLGPAPEREMARQISERVGPSGTNRDYLLRLVAVLEERGVLEPGLRSLGQAVVAREKLR